MTRTRRPIWLWFAIAWLILGVLYAYPMWASVSGVISPWESITRGLTHVTPVALAGIGIWWFTGIASGRLAVVGASSRSTFSPRPRLGSPGWRSTPPSSRGAPGYPIAFKIVRVFAGFQVLDGVILYASIAAVSYVIRIAKRLREQEARAARAESLRMRAELAAIRGRLNPHFLFNTLHTLTALVRRDPETAEQALERFGDMLRYVLDVKRSAREDVTLADELQFVRSYLSLEQLRLGDRLVAVERIDPDALDCRIPSLTLQPLGRERDQVRHRAAGAWRASRDCGVVRRRARWSSRCAMTGRAPAPAPPRTPSGMGLRAVRQALETRYAGQARFDIVTAPGEGFAVVMHAADADDRRAARRRDVMKTRAIVVEDEPIARQQLRDLLTEVDWIECIGEAADGRSAVATIDELKPDLVFLDIEMPEMSGLDVLSAIHHEPAVVFTTAYDRFAVAAFELEAIDYLLKPFGRERLRAALERVRRAVNDDADVPVARRAHEALDQLSGDGLLTRLFVRDRGRILPIAVHEIERLEADDDYVGVYVRGRRFLVYLNMNEFEARLDHTRFLRIHRSHIVNLDHVAAMVPFDATRLQIEMKDKTKLIASRTKSRELRSLAI